jgi:uncharacterized membrane protein YphA (DoxX/SURF4 family)
MKIAANVAGALLGLLFVVFGSNFFLNFIPMPPPPPEGTPVAMFFGAFFATGYLAFVKALEILGGLLVALPRTRPWVCWCWFRSSSTFSPFTPLSWPGRACLRRRSS